MALAQSALSTQTPVSGLNGNTFVIFLPLVNSGNGVISDVQVTAATVNGAFLVNPSLPFKLPAALRSNDFSVLDLQFTGSNLVTGSQHLVTVRGTYQSGGQVFGFTVNRFVTVTVPSGSELTEIQQSVDIDAVIAKANTLPGLDVVADNQALLAMIQSIPDFVQSGIDGPSSSVWAAFADGTPFVLANDRRSTSSSASSSSASPGRTVAQPQIGLVGPANRRRDSVNAGSASAPPTGIPATSQVRLLWADGYPQTGNAIAGALDPWLRAGNYSTNQQIQFPSLFENATIDDLKNVDGDGVLYFNSHGGFWGNGTALYPLTFVVATSIDWSPVFDELYKEDIRPDEGPPRLIAMGVKINGQKVRRYGITAAFVTTYWKKFSDKSFVYIDACSSDDPRPSMDEGSGFTPPQTSAQDFKRAVLSKNVSVYAGWTSSNDVNIALATDLLLFDRLLGANQWDNFSLPFSGFESGEFLKERLSDANGTTFYQRPFDWQSVIQSDAQKHSIQWLEGDRGPFTSPLGVDNISLCDSGPGLPRQHCNAVLQFTPNPDMDDVFGLLAPSIQTLYVDELNNQLHIGGIFGSDPRNSPGDPNGAVFVGYGASAPVPIVNWQANAITTELPTAGESSAGDVFVMVGNHKSNVARLTEWIGTFRTTAVGGGDGSLAQNDTYNVAFRADIRQFRLMIHEAPKDPYYPPEVFIAGSSDARYVCTGAASSQGSLYQWNGSGTLPASNPLAPVPGTFAMFFGVLSHMQLEIALGPNPGGVFANCTYAVYNDLGQLEFQSPLPVCYPPPFSVTLDTQSAIEATPGGSAAFDPSSAPFNCDVQSATPFTPQATAQWDRIPAVAGTPPDPSSAR
jgi:hypothetical protein